MHCIAGRHGATFPGEPAGAGPMDSDPGQPWEVVQRSVAQFGNEPSLVVLSMGLRWLDARRALSPRTGPAMNAKRLRSGRLAPFGGQVWHPVVRMGGPASAKRAAVDVSWAI